MIVCIYQWWVSEIQQVMGLYNAVQFIYFYYFHFELIWNLCCDILCQQELQSVDTFLILLYKDLITSFNFLLTFIS